MYKKRYAIFLKQNWRGETCTFKRPIHNLSVLKGVRPNNFHAIFTSIRINHKRIMEKVYIILYELLPLKFFEINSTIILCMKTRHQIVKVKNQ